MYATFSSRDDEHKKHVNRALVDPDSKKSKVFPYSLPSVGPGVDPGVQAVSPQVT